MSFFLQRTVKIDILKSRKGIGEPPNRPSGRRRLCAVQAFSPQVKTLAQGAALPTPSIEIPKGGDRLRRSEPKTKGHPFGCPFVLVEAGRVELPSENPSMGTSPGADGYCGSLSPCSPFRMASRHAVRSGERSSSRGRGNSYPPHGRHINDAFPGLWPLRFRRPPLIRQQ